jgi:hypothetical protein
LKNDVEGYGREAGPRNSMKMKLEYCLEPNGCIGLMSMEGEEKGHCREAGPRNLLMMKVMNIVCREPKCWVWLNDVLKVKKTIWFVMVLWIGVEENVFHSGRGLAMFWRSHYDLGVGIKKIKKIKG